MLFREITLFLKNQKKHTNRLQCVNSEQKMLVLKRAVCILTTVLLGNGTGILHTQIIV